jgi:hypothetical protein
VSVSALSRQHLTAAVLVASALLIAFWQIMAHRSARPWEPFELTAADFEVFQLSVQDWDVERKPPGNDPLQPDILVLRLTPRDTSATGAAALPVQVRLMHGYNMCDCMRIKGYTVDLVADARRPEVGPDAAGPPRYQLWRLTSGGGEISLWATSMLRAGDLAMTGIDTRAMAFPRIGTPDDPRWVPEGLTLRSLRHPVRNLRWFLRAKWNNSRTDLLTFLKLRRPAWGSDEILTLVSTAVPGSELAGQQGPVAHRVLAAHTAVYGELRAWKANRDSRE